MYRWSVFLLVVALAWPVLAWPVGGAAAVICAGSAASMPCCERGMEDCGTPGMTADCCILVPGEEPPPAVSAPGLDSASVLRGHLAALVPVFVSAPAIELHDTAPRGAASTRVRLHAEPYFSRTTVLLI